MGYTTRLGGTETWHFRLGRRTWSKRYSPMPIRRSLTVRSAFLLLIGRRTVSMSIRHRVGLLQSATAIAANRRGLSQRCQFTVVAPTIMGTRIHRKHRAGSRVGGSTVTPLG